jgi:hypothetical protein
MITLVTFTDDAMTRSADLCASSAHAHGVEKIWVQRQGNVKNWIYPQNEPEVFRQPSDPRRAWAHWAWKPLIIDTVYDYAKKDDVIIYADAGVEFINNVKHIIDRMDQDIFLFGNSWQHAHWCKRDVIEAIFPMQPVGTSETGGTVFMGRSWADFGKQVQASVIFFRVSDYTRAFVKEWLDWCLLDDGRLIDDSPSKTPNHPEFKEHRHDQAILTTMAYREGIKLHWWPAVYNDGAFIYERGDYPDEGYPVLFHHHRRRNQEWTQVA